VRLLIESVADDGSPDVLRHKIIRRGWIAMWRDTGQLAAGWFWDANIGVLDQRCGQALHAAFTGMVQMLHAASDERHRHHIAEVRSLAAEYLSIRGVELVNK
jgi:hypothetical protein